MLALIADGVENQANLQRIDDAAQLLGATRATEVSGRLIAVENAPGAQEIYGRRPLRGDATLAVGNERRGLSRAMRAAADETVVIPTLSRSVTTLNVAAAAAVAGWYVLRGSGAQAHVTRPERRRPSLLIVGDDHVEVGSSLRSAAAFGFRDVLLEDRGAGWFDGAGGIRREARAAARRHKNPLRVHRATAESVIPRYDEVVLVTPSGRDAPVSRMRLTHGAKQLVVVGVLAEQLDDERVRLSTLGLEPVESLPLRLSASIVLAEIARQVGRRRQAVGRAPRTPRYEKALELARAADALIVQPEELLAY